MNNHNDFNTSQTEQRGATNAFLADRFRNSTEMFQPRPVSAPVDDGMTMVMDPISQDDLRTDLQSDPFPVAITSVHQARGGLSTPKRAGLVGATLLAAALLVYIGRGYIHEPSETVQPTELAAPAETDEVDDTIAEIPLTATTILSEPIDTTPLAAPSAPAVVVLAPISDAVIPVTSASLPPIEPNAGSASSTAAPTESTDQVAVQSQPDAATEPVAELPAPAAGTNELESTTDQVVAEPAATTDEVADQTETTAAADQTETPVPTVADQTTSNAEPVATTDSSTGPVAQSELPRPASQPQDPRGTDNRAAGEGLKVASQVLNKVSQPISNVGQAGRYFGQR